MREIKFRAWFVTHKKMYSDYEFMNMSGFVGFLKNKTVIPMQFTGLHDKNGKEIWEGDIVESTSELILIERNIPTGKMMTQRYSIEYQIDKAMFGRKGIPSGRFELWPMTQEQMTEYYIVIGNIYENPELMEKQ